MNKIRITFLTANFLFYFVHWMVLAYLPIVFKSYSLTDAQIGFIIGLYSISSMTLMVPMGFFSDYFSPKKIVMAGAFLLALYFLSLLFVRDFLGLIPVVIVGGIGSAALTTVLYALYLKIIEKGKRGKQVAFFQLGSYLGYGLGPLTGGLLLSAVQPPGLFKMALVISLVLILVTFLLQDSTPITFSFREYRKDLREPATMFLIVGVFVMATHFGVEQTSFSLLMKEDIKLTPSQIGLIFSGIGLWMACLVPLAGYLRDRRQKIFTFLWVGLLVSSIFQFITGLVSSPGTLLFVRILHTTGDTLAILEVGVLTALLFPEHRLGGNSGLLFGVRTLAMFAGSFIAGLLNMKLGYGFSFMANGVFVFIFAISILIFCKLHPIATGFLQTSASPQISNPSSRRQ